MKKATNATARVNPKPRDVFSKIVDFHALDMRESLASSERSLEDWIDYIIEEFTELRDAIQGGDIGSVIDEAGDALGNVCALVLRLHQEGFDFNAMMEAHVAKYHERKPWIFPGYKPPKPVTPEDENAAWYANKATVETVRRQAAIEAMREAPCSICGDVFACLECGDCVGCGDCYCDCEEERDYV